MAKDPIETVLKQAAQGDARAIDALIEQNLPALLGYVRCRIDPVIRDHESCADIVQSVCREVLEAEEKFDYRGLPAFRKWLFTKALAKLMDRKRFYLAEKRNPERELRVSSFTAGTKIEGLYASLCSPSQAAVAKEDIERLERAFDKLQEDYQEVLRLAHYVGMSRAESAVEMGRSVGAVRVLLHRALGLLGLLMHEEEEESG